MKNYRNIKRIFEQEIIQTDPNQVQSAQTIELTQAQPSQTESPIDLPEPAHTDFETQINPLQMQVSDFIAKCKEIDPLVCMGIEAFIEKNKSAFNNSNDTSLQNNNEPDITFSNTVASAPIESPEMSLDFPA